MTEKGEKKKMEKVFGVSVDGTDSAALGTSKYMLMEAIIGAANREPEALTVSREEEAKEIWPFGQEQEPRVKTV